MWFFSENSMKFNRNGTTEKSVASARPLEAMQGYRAMFDLKLTDDSIAPINLRLYLCANDQPLTETWLYQWTPERRTL
jgi:glucan biosynthesis protein